MRNNTKLKKILEGHEMQLFLLDNGNIEAIVTSISNHYSLITNARNMTALLDDIQRGIGKELNLLASKHTLQ